MMVGLFTLEAPEQGIYYSINLVLVGGVFLAATKAIVKTHGSCEACGGCMNGALEDVLGFHFFTSS